MKQVIKLYINIYISNNKYINQTKLGYTYLILKNKIRFLAQKAKEHFYVEF